MSRSKAKSVLIAKLAEDDDFKDEIRQFAAHFASSKLSSLLLESYIQSTRNESDSSSDESEGELCACKCQRVAHKAHKDKTDKRESKDRKHRNKEVDDHKALIKVSNISDKSDSQQTVDNSHKTAANSDDNQLNVNCTNIINKSNDDVVNDDNSGDDECDDDQNEENDCEENADCNEGAVKADEDEDEELKRKRKSEKKKAKKKKKRDKKKEEKKKSESINNNTNNSANNQKGSDGNKGKVNGKTNNCDAKSNNKSADNDKCSRNESETAEHVSRNGTPEGDKNKSSPKSGRSSDGQSGDAEEEELSFSSAYVSQIAQRKSKPSKSAQIQSEATHEYNNNFCDDYYRSGAYNTHNNSNISSNSSNSSSNGFQIKPIKEHNDVLSYKMNAFAEQKARPVNSSNKASKEYNPQFAEKVIELATLGNRKAEESKFNEAIELFTQALQYSPSDDVKYRLYVNRSFCYDSIQDFRSALKDAECAIRLRPHWPKCYYRKGKAYIGLKNYQEAEIALKKVIEIESNCDEALTELWHVRYAAILDMGYDASTAKLYASQFDTIKASIEALSNKNIRCATFYDVNNSQALRKPNMPFGGVSAMQQKREFNLAVGTNPFSIDSNDIWKDDDIYVSDEEYESENAYYIENIVEDNSPTNPFGWKALWVGNVALNAKLDTIMSMFGKFGKLNYCNIFNGNNGGNFILVHYDNSDSPRLAMTKYQGKIIPGVSIADSPLTIRFRPNIDQKKPNYDQRLVSDECYYWRTTGCARGDKCLYKHIPANKGVDKQAWMCNPLKNRLNNTNNKK